MAIHRNRIKLPLARAAQIGGLRVRKLCSSHKPMPLGSGRMDAVSNVRLHRDAPGQTIFGLYRLDSLSTDQLSIKDPQQVIRYV